MQEGECKGMGLVSVNRSQKGEKGPRSSNSDHVKSSKMEVDLRRKGFCFGERFLFREMLQAFLLMYSNFHLVISL